MGAANCPETPRQKMIGMMYLVLTAMLALNVSKDILNAFAIVDQTILSAREITESNIASDVFQLQKQEMIYGEEKVKDAMADYRIIEKESNDLVVYIEALSDSLIKFVDGTQFYEDSAGNEVRKTVKEVSAKDNYSKPSEYMIGNEVTGKGKAFELRAMMDTYRNKMLSLVKPDDRQMLDDKMPLKTNLVYKSNNGAERSWEDYHFNGTITVAALTLLNQIKGEVRQVQSDLMSYTVASISADDFKFNQINGRAIPESKVVFMGDSYSADIIVAALDTLQNPEVYYKMGIDNLPADQMSSAKKVVGKGGKVTLEFPASSAGEVKYAGLIVINGPDGLPKSYPFNESYTVLKPTATVAAEKMNVLYIGIPNPLSVSCPVSPDKVSIALEGGGTQTKTGDGMYDVSVPANLAGKTVKISVNADGKSMGSTTFRVKRVPDPTPTIGANIRGGRVPKNQLTANPFVIAKMPEDFVYDLKWQVQSYQVTFVEGGMEAAPVTVQGANFPESVKTKIKNAKRGTTIWFTGIKAKSPAGVRTLNDIAIRIR